MLCKISREINRKRLLPAPKIFCANLRNITLCCFFCTVLSQNCTAPSQSELRDFFMFIIIIKAKNRYEILGSWLKSLIMLTLLSQREVNFCICYRLMWLYHWYKLYCFEAFAKARMKTFLQWWSCQLRGLAKTAY
jgi:hypothetical protein